MAFANTAEKVEALRIVPAAREANGRKQRATTRKGQAEEIGERKRESEDEAMRVALNHPHRRMEGEGGTIPRFRIEDGKRVPNHPRDPNAGYALGRLYMHGHIVRDQLIAGRRYTELALRYMQHITGHLPKFPSQAINDTINGLACTADMSDEDAFKLRRSWQEAQTALADTNEWHACGSALTSVCVMDREVKHDAELGALRIGLNALYRLWS